MAFTDCPAVGGGGGVKPKTASSASLHVCQHEDVYGHGADAAVGGAGQLVQQSLRPPSRQRPSAESLHLFNGFAAL
jgi:hypothetical protein